MYLVISCSDCGTPRVAKKGNQSTQCTRCGKRLPLDRVIVHAETESAEQARDAVGQINAKRAGGELLRPDASTPAGDGQGGNDGPGDRLDQAIHEAREYTAQAMRVRLTAEGLAAQFGTFTEEQWLEAMGRLDVAEPKAREHLEKLVQMNLLAQPDRGVYRYLG